MDHGSGVGDSGRVGEVGLKYGFVTAEVRRQGEAPWSV